MNNILGFLSTALIAVSCTSSVRAQEWPQFSPDIGLYQVGGDDAPNLRHQTGESLAAASLAGRMIYIQPADNDDSPLMYFRQPDGTLNGFTWTQLQAVGLESVPWAVSFLPNERHVLAWLSSNGRTDETDGPIVYASLMIQFSRGYSPADGYSDAIDIPLDFDPRLTTNGNSSFGGPELFFRPAELTLRCSLSGQLHALAMYTIQRNDGGAQASQDYLVYTSGRMDQWEGTLLLDGIGSSDYDTENGIRHTSLALAPDGTPHAAARRNLGVTDGATTAIVGSQVLHLELGGDGWHSEVVAEDDYLSGDEDFSDANPAVAVYPDGRVGVAWTFTKSVETGSVYLSHLMYSERSISGEWQTRAILTTADNFCGNDGCQFTGYAPQHHVDFAGRAHILFMDVGRSHLDCCGQLRWPGNMRYGWNNGSGWEFRTILRQPSVPKRESDDDHFLFSPALAASYAGDRLGAFGFTQHIQRDGAGDWVDDTVRVFTVGIQQESLVNVEPPDEFGFLLGTEPTLPEDDRNGDGCVDAADVIAGG